MLVYRPPAFDPLKYVFLYRWFSLIAIFFIENVIFFLERKKQRTSVTVGDIRLCVIFQPRCCVYPRPRLNFVFISKTAVTMLRFRFIGTFWFTPNLIFKQSSRLHQIWSLTKVLVYIELDLYPKFSFKLNSIFNKSSLPTFFQESTVLTFLKESKKKKRWTGEN